MDLLETTIVIPKKCVEPLLWQRADCRSPILRALMGGKGGKVLQMLINKDFYLKYLAGSVIETSRRSNIGKLYSQDMTFIFNKMKPFLPSKVDKSLDIGCGVGGIDILIAKHYMINQSEIWLLDKDDDSPKRGEHYSGFNQETAAYNSLDLSRTLLIANGIDEQRIHTVNIAEDEFPSESFDLVISLYSWGFHYPIEVYINKVCQSLTKEAALFIDVRKGTNGLNILEDRFSTLSIIYSGRKHDFVYASGMRHNFTGV